MKKTHHREAFCISGIEAGVGYYVYYLFIFFSQIKPTILQFCTFVSWSKPGKRIHLFCCFCLPCLWIYILYAVETHFYPSFFKFRWYLFVYSTLYILCCSVGRWFANELQTIGSQHANNNQRMRTHAQEH